MQLRPNKMLQKLRAGETVVSTAVGIDSGRAVQIAGACGFPAVWLDQEHRPNDISLIEKQIFAAHSCGMDTIVRIPRGDYSHMLYPLEMDASAIMVPHVASEAEAKEIVKTARFQPIGRRPIDGGNRDGGFCLVSPKEYTSFVNENRMLIVQIEDPEAMEELDAICAVPGIDMVFFGPGDYAHGLGIVGETNDPRVCDARAAVAEAARKAGIPAGTVGSPAVLAEYQEMGYSLINIGSATVALTTYFQSNLQEAEKAL